MARRGKLSSGPSGVRRVVGRVAGGNERRSGQLPHIINRLSKKANAVQQASLLGLSSARVVVLVLLLCGLGLTLAMPLRTYLDQREQAEVVAAEQVKLRNEIAELKERKDQQADPAYIRAQSRDRLRLVMPGEAPVQVQLPGAYEADQASRARVESPTPPWYVSVWNSVAYPPDYQWDPANPTGPEPKDDNPIDPIDPIN